MRNNYVRLRFSEYFNKWVPLVHVFEGKAGLCKPLHDFVLGQEVTQFLLPLNFLMHVATITVVHYNAQPPLPRHEHLLEADL